LDHAFVDTSFLVARFSQRDRNHRLAAKFLDAQRQPGADVLRLVLSDFVFDETVTTLRFRAGRHDVAAAAGRVILESKAFDRVSVEAPVFQAAWSLFLERPDKHWSFTDCTSFALMENLDLRKALAFDRNFAEAGFAVLP
jgi:predicted nucleic acid-binding protein